MKLTFKTLASKIMAFLGQSLVPYTVPTVNGAMTDPGSVLNALAQLAANSIPASGTLNVTTTSASTATLTAMGNAFLKLTQAGATTVTFDSAYNIALNLPAPLALGQQFIFSIFASGASTTVATPTLSDTAVTLAGTTSVVAAAVRTYQGVITQLTSLTGSLYTAGTTFTSLTQVGSTNNFTVALGTNAISPTVGNLIFLNVTTGTLPSGWYPINKVTSATSFVIATPAGTVWTATAATVGTGNPTTPVFSPTITITAVISSATTTSIV